MRDFEAAIAVVDAGAAVVRRRFGTQLERIEKGADDFATDADLEAEEAMRSLLRRMLPGDTILGEERGLSGPDGAARMWLLDPLCGTLNYAARMPVASVNAALGIGGRIVAAAVADPFSGEIFWTDGRSASVRREGRDSPLAPDAGSRLVDLNLDPPFPSAPRFRAALLPADPEFGACFRVRVVSTSLALTWVATGQRSAYVTDGDVRDSLHFAAGIAICEAAGCRVTDLRGRALARAGTGLIAAADSATHAVLVALVTKYLGGGSESGD